MVVSEIYKLSGYIEYISSRVGFVTPVFMDDKGRYCIQVSAGQARICEWEFLPEIYSTKVNSIEATQNSAYHAFFLYGFKNNDSIFFGLGLEMANYLTELLANGLSEGKQLANTFIQKWQSLEPSKEKLTKESIWNESLELVKILSSTMPVIFQENIEAKLYVNGILYLRIENDGVRRIFEDKFKERLTTHFRKRNENFEIVVEEPDLTEPLIIHFSEDGKNSFEQGSFIMETKIKPFQDFENFIIGDFNENAYSQALDFVRKDNGAVLTITGDWGVGKTYLANSIGRHFSIHGAEKKVGMYTAFSRANNKPEITPEEIEHFKALASDNDIIIIDDAHHISSEKVSFQRFVRVVKEWKYRNKIVVLSFCNSTSIDITPELLDESEQVVLTRPGIDDKLKIIESKSNSYNLPLVINDIKANTDFERLHNFTDIERYLAKVCLSKEITQTTYRSFWSYFSAKDLNDKVFESSISEYFKLHMEYSHQKYSEVSYLNEKIVSYFIKDIFSINDEKSEVDKSKHSYDVMFFSIDTMRYYFFESKPFRKTIIDILRNVVFRGGMIG